MSRFVSFPHRFLLGSLLLASFSLTAPLRAQLPMDSAQAGPNAAMEQQVADLQKVADRWDDAVGQHDPYALELVLAPQYIGISDSGQVNNRDQVISQMVAKGAPRYTLTQKVTSVRVLGDAAVVNGTYDRVYQGSRLSHTKLQDQKGVFSQVYVRARTSWQCINSQRTLLQEPTLKSRKEKAKAAAKERPLTHGLGFQLPGRHSSDNSNAEPQQ